MVVICCLGTCDINLSVIQIIIPREAERPSFMVLTNLEVVSHSISSKPLNKKTKMINTYNTYQQQVIGQLV